MNNDGIHLRRQNLLAETLQFAGQVDAFTTKVIGSQGSQGNNHRVVKMAQVVRMLRTFQSILTLIRADLNDGAGALVRCILEQYFVFRAIDEDKEMLRRATEEIEAEGYKAIKGLLTMDSSARADELTNEALEEALGSMRQGSGFNAYDWAAKTGMGDVHRTLWRILSSYVHGSIGILERYVELNEAGEAVSVRSRIARLEAIEFLLSSSSMLLDCTERIDAVPNTEARRAMLGFLAADQSSLYQRYWKLKEEIDLHGRSQSAYSSES